MSKQRGKYGRWSLAMAGAWAAALVLAGLPSISRASPELNIIASSGSGSVSQLITTPVVGHPNEVQYIGPLGDFVLNITTGVSSSPVPALDLSSVNISGGAGTVDIWLTDQNFTSTASALSFLAQVGGTTTSSNPLTFTFYGDSQNRLFNTSQTLGTLVASSASYGLSTIGSLATLGAGQPFSLTVHAHISHNAAGETTAFDQNLSSLAVPEPASLVLLGLGLVGLGLASASRRHRHSA